MNKFQWYFVIIEFLILYSYHVRKVNIKHLVIFSFVSLLVILSAYSTIYKGYGNYIDTSARAEANEFRLSGVLNALSDPYIYIVYNFDNLQNYMFNINGTFGDAGSLLNEPSKIIKSKADNISWKKSLNIRWLTTGTFYKEMFQSLGFFGLVFWPFVLGILSTHFYYLAHKSNNIFYWFTNISISFGLMISFFSNIFIQSVLMTNIIFAYLISNYVAKRYSKNKGSIAAW
jgi:oligosaccharide repeat unit polymerase